MSPILLCKMKSVAQWGGGDKQAKLALGIRYEMGNGVPVDYERAEQFYREAAADSGGALWVYSPPVSKNDQGRVLPIDRGPTIPGLEEAKRRLAGLRARIVEKEGYR